MVFLEALYRPEGSLIGPRRVLQRLQEALSLLCRELDGHFLFGKACWFLAVFRRFAHTILAIADGFNDDGGVCKSNPSQKLVGLTSVMGMVIFGLEQLKTGSSISQGSSIESRNISSSK